MTWTSLRSGMASSGVRLSAQIAPAMPNAVRMRTRNGLRALASMIFSRRNGFAWTGAMESWSFGVMGSGIGSPGFEGALNLRFGVNQEVGAVDNALAIRQPGLEFVNVAVLAAKFEEAWFEFAVAFVHER